MWKVKKMAREIYKQKDCMDNYFIALVLFGLLKVTSITKYYIRTHNRIHTINSFSQSLHIGISHAYNYLIIPKIPS